MLLLQQCDKPPSAQHPDQQPATKDTLCVLQRARVCRPSRD